MKIACLCVLVIFIQTISSFRADIKGTQLCRRYALKNGKTKYRHRGRFVRFLCNPGYSLYGDSFGTCANGVWDINSTPLCVRNSCKKFDQHPSNMLIYPEKGGAVLTFICVNGYTLNGNNKTYCDGRQWLNNTPICLETNTKPSLSCDFEKEDICGWTHDLNHDFDWRRRNYLTPSGLIGTGPAYDHTKGSGKDGYYMYIESSSRYENDTARLLSPVYEKTTTDTCFEFYYHMHGQTMGTMKVYLKKVSESFDLQQSKVIFNMSGNRGFQWFKYFVMLGPINEDYQIIIEGIRGKSYYSDIAIDDVRIIENCEMPTEATSTTEFIDPTDSITIETCENRCGQNATISVEINVISCDCDDDCLIKNRCCPDYFDHCVFDTTTELYTTTDVPNEIQTEVQPVQTTIKVIPTTVKTSTTVTTSTKRPSVITQRATTKKTTPFRFSFVEHTTPFIHKRLKPFTTFTPRKTSTTTKKLISRTTTIQVTPATTTIKNNIIFMKPSKKESDYSNVPTKTPEEDYFEENYMDVIENELKEPHDRHYHGQITNNTPESDKLKNMVFIVSCIIGTLVIVIVSTIIAKKYFSKRIRMRNCSSNSQSDVRFLTSDEILDFTLSKDYDDL